MKIKTLAEQKNLRGKRVLVRVDFNVPLKNGKIKELYKIEKSLPTIEFLCKAGSKVILISHLGRPKGEDKRLSLKPVSVALGKMLEKKISLLTISDKILGNEKQLENLQKKIVALKNGDIVLLENIRFIKGEENNDPKIARTLGTLGDLFVLDGFAVAHRDAASVSGIGKYLPACAGLLMEKEIDGLTKILQKPKKPFVVVLGGAKMETKVPLIKKFIPKASQILIGGGIFNTCLWAKGVKVGSSIIDKNYKKTALSYWKNKKIIMPVDIVVGELNGKSARVVQFDSKFKIPNTKLAIFDIGPKTVSLFAKYIRKANTIVWNGAVGMFEVAPYHWGSDAIAHLFASRAKGKAFGVTGGGETVEMVKKLKLLDDIDLVSTGGGAMLEYLSGNKLPGIKVVIKK